MPIKTVGDDIDKYLDKVFGNFPSPTQADAECWQEKLGVPVSLEDVDLIYTLQAIASEDQSLFPETVDGSSHRIKTRLFLGAIEDMRAEMDNRLRGAVADLMAKGVPDYEAVRKTLLRTLSAADLRRQVIGAGGAYCRQKTLKRVRTRRYFVGNETGKSSQIASLPYMIFLFVYPICIIFASHVNIFSNEGLEVRAVFGGCALLAGIGASYFTSCPIPNESLLSDFSRFLSKPPLPNATAFQRLRRFMFKLNYTPPPLSIISPSFIWIPIVTFAVACLCTTHFRNDFLFLLYCALTGGYLGKGIWCRVRSHNGGRAISWLPPG